MTAFATAAELAQLPGFPGSERRAREAARRMGLPSRPRVGRGGGLEWLVPAQQKPRFKLHLDGRLTLLKSGGAL
jgi:hypothetical protein